MEQDLMLEFQMAKQVYDTATEGLVPLAERVALASVVDAFPATHAIETKGEVDEDWIPRLRIQRVIDVDGVVLFDVNLGHPDREIEDAIDVVNTEYLDLILDLTGDQYMGHKVIMQLEVWKVRDAVRGRDHG